MYTHTHTHTKPKDKTKQRYTIVLYRKLQNIAERDFTRPNK